MEETDVLDGVKGYPNGPDDERLVNLTVEDLRLLVFAYSNEVREMKQDMAQIQEIMWHEALYDHEENIIQISKSPLGKKTVRCFPIKETTVMHIHSLCASRTKTEHDQTQVVRRRSEKKATLVRGD